MPTEICAQDLGTDVQEVPSVGADSQLLVQTLVTCFEIAIQRKVVDFETAIPFFCA